MRKTLFIILSSFLLNSCYINQMNILGLCTEPIEVSNAPLKEILSAKNESIIINSKKYTGLIIPYDTELPCGCYQFIGLPIASDYKDKYWYGYIYEDKNKNKTYKFIVIESPNTNSKKLNNTINIVKNFPDFLVVERTELDGTKKFILINYELQTKPV